MADLRRPPPPRWRVVERNRRLEVIDLRSGGTPEASRWPAGPAGETRFDRVLRGVAVVACQGVTDHAGRPILTTRDWFDADGPRELVLGPDSTQRLGAAILGAGLAVIGLMVIVAIFGFVALALPAVAWVLLGKAAPFAARWWFRGFPDSSGETIAR